MFAVTAVLAIGLVAAAAIFLYWQDRLIQAERMLKLVVGNTDRSRCSLMKNYVENSAIYFSNLVLQTKVNQIEPKGTRVSMIITAGTIH